MVNVPNKFVSGMDFSSFSVEQSGAQVLPHAEGVFEGEGVKEKNSGLGSSKKLSNLVRGALFAVLTGSAVVGSAPGCASATYNSEPRIAGRNGIVGEKLFHNFNFSNYPLLTEEDLRIASERSKDDLVKNREHCSEMHPLRLCSESKEGDSLRQEPGKPQVYYTVDGASFEITSAGSLIVFMENAKNRNLIKNFFLFEYARIQGEDSRFRTFGVWRTGFNGEPLDIKVEPSKGAGGSQKNDSLSSGRRAEENENIDENENGENKKVKRRLRYFETPEFKERLAKARSIMNLKDLRNTTQLLKIYKLIGKDPELYGFFTRFAVQYDWDPGTDDIYQYRHPVDTLRTGRGDCDDYSMQHYFWSYQQGYKPYLVFTRKEINDSDSLGHVFVWYYDENGNRIVLDNGWAYRYRSSVPITKIVKENSIGDWKIVENLHYPVPRGRR